MNNQANKNSGFSLVETLVAISILLIVVVGPMTIIANATNGSNFSNEQIIAFFLAQEGAELAQKARDDLLLPEFTTTAGAPDNSGWTNFSGTSGGDPFDECFDDGAGAAEVCGLAAATDFTGSVSVVDCSVANIDNCRLHIDSSSANRARYTHTVSATTQPTVFTRTISMNETGGREIEVTSRVTWTTGEQRAVQQAEVKTYLYNVYGR